MSRWLRDYEVGGVTVEDLEHLLNECRDRGVRVVLVRPPVSSPFRAVYTPPVLEAFSAYVERVRREFGCGFVDCSSWVADRFFADSHHIRDGRGFTRELTRRVIAPEWRRITSTSGRSAKSNAPPRKPDRSTGPPR